MTKSYFIGIDSGTQSTKSVLVEFDASRISCRIIGQSSQSYGLIEDSLGTKEQDPALWIKAVQYTILDILAKGRINRKLVKGIGVSGQQHGFVALDKDDKVIRPAKLWNDTSTHSQCEYLINKLGGEKKVVSLIGNNILTGYTASKILWLKEKEPGNYSKLNTILLPHNYINFWLTGEKRMEYSDASGTAMFDIRSHKWSSKVLKAIDSRRDISSYLPKLQLSHEICGRLKGSVAREIGLSSDVIVSSGGGDNMMGAIGTGNVTPGIVTASLGTSGTIVAYSSRPAVDKNGELACFCDSTGGWLSLVCMMNVTVATELAKKAFGYSNNDLNRVIEKVPSGSEGLMLLPYFSGERTPNIPDGTGVYFGVNSQTFNKAYFARAAMEGATLSMKYGLEILKKCGIKPKEIRLTGGGAKSALWRQIVADVFNCPVVGVEVEEAAAFGAGIQSIWAYNYQQNKPILISKLTKKLVRTDRKTLCLPNKKNVARYDKIFAIELKLIGQLKEIFALRRNTIKNII
jgi:xylulokinase